MLTYVGLRCTLDVNEYETIEHFFESPNMHFLREEGVDNNQHNEIYSKRQKILLTRINLEPLEFFSPTLLSELAWKILE